MEDKKDWLQPGCYARIHGSRVLVNELGTSLPTWKTQLVLVLRITGDLADCEHINQGSELKTSLFGQTIPVTILVPDTPAHSRASATTAYPEGTLARILSLATALNGNDVRDLSVRVQTSTHFDEWTAEVGTLSLRLQRTAGNTADEAVRYLAEDLLRIVKDKAQSLREQLAKVTELLEEETDA